MSALAELGRTRDIRRADEAGLGRAQSLEAVGRLVGGVAHDFNNLLTGIVLCCDLMLSKLERDHPLRRYVDEIRSAGVHGAELIQQLLAVARQRTLEPRVLSLNEVIRGMRTLLLRLIGEDIELVTELADDLGLLKIDPAQAQQIVLNLVLNARDAMPDGGRIALSTRNCDRKGTAGGTNACVEFLASDTGCGMDALTQAHVFEPFFTTKPAGHGNGMGLSTIHDIVTRYGGTIEIESEPGKGTRFVIRLPRFDAERMEEREDDRNTVRGKSA